MPGYIFILVLLAVLWLFLIRPRQRQMRRQQQELSQLELGDEIVTAGGLYGTVRSIEDDVLEIELAPGTIVRLDRRAVAAVVSEPEPDVELEEPEMPHPEQQIPPDDG